MKTPERWEPENEQFWEETGKSVANRNLWISIPNLLLGFSIWIYWGVLVGLMQGLHDVDATLFAFTFGNDGEPLTGAAYKALALYPAGCGGANRRNNPHPELVHDRYLRWAQC